MKVAAQQLAFDFQTSSAKNIEVHGREYRSLNLLRPKSCTHAPVYVNDAMCRGYEPGEPCREIYFETKELRDIYLRELNEIDGTDRHGNNICGWVPVGDYQNGAFIFGLKLYGEKLQENLARYSQGLEV